jgi:transposase-like protein
VTQDDLLYRFRLRVFAIATELGNVRAACRAMGIHPSTYYRWKRQLERHGPEILRPRERRVPRMANATSP